VRLTGDSSDDHSACITADNYDSDNVTFEGKCKEPICPGDMIEYNSPIFVAGDPRGLRDTFILAVEPNDNFSLVLSNAEGLPSTIAVKRINLIWHNRLVDHCGTFWTIDWFQLKKRGSATDADEVYMQAIDNTLSATQFCCGIHEFIESNMNRFVGVCLDDNNAVFQFPWGQMSRLKKSMQSNCQ
jgi:hypothetical protein